MFNLSNIKEKWNNNKKYLLPIGVVLLIGSVFYAGYATKPAEVIEKEKVVEKLVEKIVERKVEVEKIVYRQAKKENTKKETTTTKKPDGTEVTHTTEETNTDTDTNVTKEKVVYVDRIIEKMVEKVVEKEKIIKAKQIDWRVAAGAGVSIPVLLGEPQLGTPGLKGVVIQAEVDRRIIGPFWLGISGNTQGVVGLNLSGVF